MAEMFTVLTPAAAWEKFCAAYAPSAPSEQSPTWDALGRVLAQEVISPQNLPEFPRSTMDGYAVQAADTWGATPGLPALLTVTGEVTMGSEATLRVELGEAMLVHTGGMIPPGADAVVMVEQTQRVDASSIEVLKAVAEGESVLGMGEDVRLGQRLLGPGHQLRPQDIGGLLALGIVEVRVAARPRVAILSTGDEVIHPREQPRLGQVRDINSYTLAALVREAGGEPLLRGIVPDDRAALEAAARDAFAAADMVIFSAGSSVSYRDLTVDVIEGLGAPGVLVHGVSIKPGKPTILAVCDGKAVFGLPGNPVSAMVIFERFVAPAIRRFLGAGPAARTRVRARLERNLNSTTGREDHVEVALSERDGELWARPVLGKSNVISTLIHAQGTLVVPLDSNGIAAGAWVEVFL